MIRDLYVPVLTPFAADGSIDTAALAKHCDWIAGHGATGVMVFGTTGEGPSIGVEEKIGTAAALVRALPGLPVIAAVTETSTPAALQCIRGYNELPLAAVLVLPPFFFPDADPDGILEFLAGAARASAHQLIGYHIPTLAPPVPVGIAGIDGFWGMKDSGGDLAFTRAALAAGNAVMVGAERTIPEAMRAGAAGTIAGMGNMMPAELAEVCALSRNGEYERAEQLLQRVLELHRNMVAVAPGMQWIAAMKEIAAHRHGIDLGRVRAPLRAAGGYLTDEVRDLLDTQ